MSTDCGTGERTSVDAISKLGCRLSTTDLLEKSLYAGRVADNQRCSRIEDRCCASHYRIPVHGNAIERCLPMTLLTKGVSALAENQCVRATTDLNGQRNPGKVAGIKCAVCASEEEFRTGCSEFETKDRRGHHALGNETLEQWRCVIHRYGLESQAHQAICWKLVALKARRILSCGAQCLRFGLGTPCQRSAVRRKAASYSQTGDANNVGILFTDGVGPIPISQ